MKNRILLLAVWALMLASCEGNTNTNLQNQQAQIDSIARVKAALQDVINQKRNDSTINAMAAAKADSIEKAEAQNKGHIIAAKPAAKDTGSHPQK